jgi:hypothetical protein
MGTSKLVGMAWSWNVPVEKMDGVQEVVAEGPGESSPVSEVSSEEA